MRNSLQFILMFALLSLALTACAGIIPVSGSAPTGVYSATPQPLTTQAVIRDAQVQSVEIQVGQADPNQVNAIVRGNLPDACTTLQNPQVSFMGDTFQIKLTVVSPANIGCAQIVTPYDQTITLDTANLTPGTYTVIANGVKAVFAIPSGSEAPVNSFELVYYDSNHNIQAVSPSFPADIVLNPYFSGLIPLGGTANGVAYVLDSTNGTKAVAVNENGIGVLDFIGRPTLYGLAVYAGSADSQPRLAWGTEYSQKYPNSTIEISNLDGSGQQTLLTQEVSEPLVQLVPEFWSADGKSLYFSKEPMGLGGYILFGGASNLYKVDLATKQVSMVTPINPYDEEPQACLDSISSDYRYVAEHCAQNFIRIRDLSSGGMANILPPDEVTTGHQLVGSARFSPDGKRIAFAVARGDQTNEQGWVVVSDSAVSNAKVILASQPGSYFMVAGWLNEETLVVQSTSVQDCSPYCASELWVVGIDGSNPQKVVDGRFIAYLPGGKIAGPLPTMQPLPTTTSGCQDSAEYVSDDGLDGTTYAPNTAFMKTWTVKNIGTCTWDSSYLVYQISGALMTQQPGYWLVAQGNTIQPGQTVDIAVGMTSPPERGNYKAYWGLKNGDGERIPIEGGADGNSFYAEINVKNGSVDTGAVTATAIDIVPEQGSGEACTASSTYFVHAYISTDGPTSVSYEIGSTAGQISAGYFEGGSGLSDYVTGTLVFTRADSKTISLRFVGPYPHPDDITVNLRVNGRDWVNTKLFCP